MKNCISFIILLCVLVSFTMTAAHAAEQTNQQILVDKATLVVRGFTSDPELGWFRERVKNAKAVLIIPQNLKGAFLIGGSGGTGVLIARQGEGGGTWGNPAFYSIGAISVGMQIGAEASEVILMVMTERGMEKLLTSSFKMGADVAVAVGSLGMGTSAQTADIISYARSKGAFTGFSLNSALVKTKDDWNAAYYGQEVSPTDILIRKTVANPQADELRQTLAALVETK